jgi:hypothetical protein
MGHEAGEPDLLVDLNADELEIKHLAEVDLACADAVRSESRAVRS